MLNQNMPELPEVEVVSRGLKPLILNRQIVAIATSGLSLRVPTPLKNLQRWAKGARVTKVARRAKFILLYLDNGAMILLHLGMTGKIYPATSQTPRRRHDHLWLTLGEIPGESCADTDTKIACPENRFSQGLNSGPNPATELRFNDSRRFGLVAVCSPQEAGNPPLLAKLGPEPLDPDAGAFTPTYLAQYCRHRPTPIKNLLMNNQMVVGIGNIYANEILFAAKVSPFAPANSLSFIACEKIVIASRKILNQAIAAGGTTIADFTNTTGESGYFQVQLQVYGRHDQPCPRCRGLIERRTQGGRPTFFCPSCQIKGVEIN